MPARTLAELLTIGGARVLGLEHRIGTSEVGKRADVICLAADEPHAVPLFDAFSHLAYAARAADVRHVVVDGNVVVTDHHLVRVDETALLAEIRDAAARVHAAVV
ncbi:MAG: amidohydrolase family protein, partial [Thermoanaerobaculales bacterium]